ncbi:MAG: deoxyguanosinetriphosphate triphosphohydrolase [Eubacteriales bacterium]|mgnify:FL=1|nr:deoxyguanosinetriphosphate triphosphohydrolase [Clostridiales bacterium]MDD6372104.1 deoxyguanosinetriphosphate triphosphohydrolase [Eubacteriales bacterium]MDD7259500.1 deoxyguanosinetriphosphate triphosphohydrolase [Eubacteriales bacterium]MDY6067345.1 deoxyguanosinetriphosphate triphosphohydrolase [Candidatus Faecousia sp.]
MTVREELERLEHRRLNPLAAFSDRSTGRPRPEPEREEDVRTCYQRDTDRIVHSKAFRRLMHKTQVFLNPEGDHYRTRMTHTLEVTRIAKTVTRALGLNEDLAEAIAMGHDLGHTPFGHAGEAALTECWGRPFRHNEQSLRVVDILEKDGQGLNLCNEVREGIVGHTGPVIPKTLEGQIVRRADQIAYVNHDIDDAIRAGILTAEDIPRDIAAILGENQRDRINTLVCDVIFTSREAGSICMTPEIQKALADLRSFMFARVYHNPVAKGEESKAKDMLQMLFRFYVDHPEQLPADFQPQLSFDGLGRTVCDYIAGMTDNYAIEKFNEIFVPSGWNVRG